MIFDTLAHSHLYHSLNPLFEKAFAFLKDEKNHRLEPGKYEIQGEALFAIVQEYPTKLLADGKWEAHKKYIDIQYMVSGSEVMGIAPIGQMKIAQAHDMENDYALFSGHGEMLTVPSGSYTLFFTHDVHMPGLIVNASENIKKIVIKVSV